MKLFYKIGSFFKNGISKISALFRTSTTLGGNLVGLKYIEERWDYCQLAAAGWTFLIGLPIGLMVVGPTFSLLIWFSIVTSVLIISNLDHSLNKFKEVNI